MCGGPGDLVPSLSRTPFGNPHPGILSLVREEAGTRWDGGAFSRDSALGPRGPLIRRGRVPDLRDLVHGDVEAVVEVQRRYSQDKQSELALLEVPQPERRAPRAQFDRDLGRIPARDVGRSAPLVLIPQ